MRVLLVAPTHLYGSAFPAPVSNTDFPVGFAYLASSLRAGGHEVFGLNPNNNPDFPSAREMLRAELTRSIGACRPELIGLGGLCTDYRFVRDAIRFCRALAPDVPIVCGGGLVTHDAPFVARALRPDFCVVGEGEEALVRLAGMMESGDTNYGTVRNIGYRKDDRYVFTPVDFACPDVDSLPFPDYEPFGIRDMLDHFGRAARNGFRYTRTDPRPMTIVTARGCPFNCTFCVHRRGPRYRARSVGNILRELGQMYERYRFNVLIVLDELFAANRARLREFCEAVIERRRTLGWDFDWSFQTHASASLTLDDLKLAKAAGCHDFSYGLESASPKVLASMNKRTRPPQIVDAIRRAHEAAIGFGGNFIFGDVAEDADSIAETLTFLKRHLPADNVSLMAIQPYPGSRLFDACIARGIIRDRRAFYEHTIGNVFNMTGLPDALWFPLMEGICSIEVPLARAWATRAEPLAEETGSVAARMFRRAGKTLFRVSSECPHCGKTVESVEALAEAPAGARGFLAAALDLYRNEGATPAAFLRHRVLPFLKRKLLLRGAGRDHPLFRLIDDLRDKGERAALAFGTGCPHCNRRYRVKIAAPS